jgi:hypothetical protein
MENDKKMRRMLKKIEKEFSIQNMMERAKWDEKNLRRKAARIKEKQRWDELLIPVEIEE